MTHRKRRDAEIAPEEIFIDTQSSFDRGRFEGRLERPLSRRTYVALFLALIAGLSILALRAADLEIVQGAALAAESAHNSLAQTAVFAPRGIITDYQGVVLAGNTETADGTLRRDFPYPELGSVLGYVSYPKKDASGNYYDTAEKGVAGLEAAFDQMLRGENGSVLVETDAAGAVRSEGSIVPAVPGATLALSLDASLERALASAVAATARRVGFVAGAGVILDVHTGAVRAIVSYPSYDPSVMSDGGPGAAIASYESDPGHPFLDHAIGGVYTPGSIVKPFIAAGALTDGVITPATVINDNARLTVPDPYHPGQEFVYTGWKALGPVDVRQAIAWSSDVFFYTVGGGYQGIKGLGIDRLDYWYKAFGLGAPSGLGLAGEASGLIPSPAWKQKALGEPWYLGDTYHTAIGQYSMQVTPIQMARATAAIANGGTLVTPTLLAGAKPVSTKVPVDPAALAVVREGMRAGVTSALAKALDLPTLAVAAKTGTAQVGASNQYDNSWVEGFYPYDNPQYAFAVVLERGPSGAGEEAVNAMRAFFDALQSGLATTTASSTLAH
ncbi:MAG: hypothetical protein KGI78_03530 [Patescibacteria group bacterium]|nr:hypothetical protein [Patescibacteria group bacterium]MDE1944017.1 hypothetical protein [Patescibacteria group bacterium]MDE1945565.1 hypothetical protein [Patescibacteria group bacterium]MDE2057898.1 hypothetical protein [Patescibacteria group bacterium]